MSKNYQEPEEVELDKNNSEAEIIDDFNPLDEAVLEKPYTKPNVKLSSADLNSDIPEPSFTPPPMTANMESEDKPKRQAPQPKPPVNQAMRDLSKKDKREAAKKFAEMIMSGYKMANDLADKALLINEGKIKKLEAEGLIDTSIVIPVSPTDTMTVAEYISEFNSQTEGTISVSKEFEAEVMPVLTDVLEESGVGLTNKQYLGYLVLKDIAAKSILVFQSISVKKAMIEQLKEATIAFREQATILQSQYNNPPRPANNDRREEPPSTPTYTYENTPPENPKGGSGNSGAGVNPNRSQVVEEIEVEDDENDFMYEEKMSNENEFDSYEDEDEDFDDEEFEDEDFEDDDYEDEDFEDGEFEENDFDEEESTEAIEVNKVDELNDELSDEPNPLDDYINAQEPEEKKESVKEETVVAEEVKETDLGQELEQNKESQEELKEEPKASNDYVQQKPTVTVVDSPKNEGKKNKDKTKK